MQEKDPNATIVFNIPYSEFTVLPSAVIMDKNLSLEAKGLYCETYSYLKNSSFAKIQDFYLRGWDKTREEVYKLLDELEAAGYVKFESEEIYENTGLKRYIYDLRNKP